MLVLKSGGCVRQIVLALWLSTVGTVGSEPLYESVVLPLEKTKSSVERLSYVDVMAPNKELLSKFVNGVEGTLSLKDEFTTNREIDQRLLKNYLEDLRQLTQMKESIDHLYKKTLTSVINQSDKKGFEELVTTPLEPLHHPRVRTDVIAFYQKNFPKNSIKNVDALCAEEALETKSIQYAIEQEKAYEEHLQILKRSDAWQLKRKYKIGSASSVLVVQEKMKNGDIVFEAENLNPYLVTLSLDIDNVSNGRINQKMPLYVEISGKTVKEIARLSPINDEEDVIYKALYGWVKGSAFANHDDNYLYRLPFSDGMNVRVSQGYHGGLSHKGLSAYAIDFSMPIGTPIYSAREGEVVGLDVSNHLGGAGPEYRPYMNYINIRHSDGTLGNYCHLKQNGSVVKIGDRIKRGQLIGYSGNTGYCTAPHLHFSVSKVDPISMRRPMNLPIKLQTLQGIVTNPREGDRYTVQ